jgi:hypothetical protein
MIAQEIILFAVYATHLPLAILAILLIGVSAWYSFFTFAILIAGYLWENPETGRSTKDKQ